MFETVAFFFLVGYSALTTGMVVGMMIYSEGLEEK